MTPSGNKKVWYSILVIVIVVGATLLVANIDSLFPKTDAVNSADDPRMANRNDHVVAASGGTKSNDVDLSGISDDELKKIVEAYKLIQENYMIEVDDQKLVEGAIRGMLDVLDDPYSVYMTPEQAKEFQNSVQSTFEGIGAEVSLENGRVTIMAPLKGSPAEKAGLRPKDQIISVNGESVEGLSLYDAVLKIRGPKGTEARLGIIRAGSSEPMTVTVIRDTIPIETVYGEMIEVKGVKIGKIEVTQFAEKTALRFNEEVKHLTDQGAQGFIIDLRGNPGGYLTAVLSMLERLLPQDQVMVQVVSREGDTQVLKTKTKGIDQPIVVLINEGSASASEIMAAALHDTSVKATLVGVTSFGKGTVQSPFTMGDDSEIKLTIAKWLTPKGEWIHKVGVKPDIEVKQPDYFNATIIPPDTVYQYDMMSNEVKNLQIILKGLGYEPGREDGYYDKGMEQAVKAFQKANHLKVTGKVDAKTAEKLQDLIIELVKNPEHDRQLQTGIQTLVEKIKSKN
ncbi:S41 family peptidase [Rubeoparvulum massiliense]|uniref:S41 family peptidase n=1 Tax=Rubeoparvulum massiliense TaxID=1631346 RepID=UPI00065DE0DC|nr:S41 family peptidase [Rubeoparvulum massiliense]